MSLVLVLCFVGVLLAQTAVLTAIRPQVRQVLRRLRSPRLLLRAGCLLAGVLAVALPLFSLGGIWSWSWLSLLGADGGHPRAGPPRVSAGDARGPGPR